MNKMNLIYIYTHNTLSTSRKLVKQYRVNVKKFYGTDLIINRNSIEKIL